MRTLKYKKVIFDAATADSVSREVEFILQGTVKDKGFSSVDAATADRVSQEVKYKIAIE